MADALAGFPVVVRISVLWSDLDAYGHVNNAVFFRYFEQARMAYLQRCGFIASYERDRIGAILHSASCRFRAPVFHPDTVAVGTKVTEIGDERFTMSYVATSEAQSTVVAEGTSIVVSFDYRRNVKAPLPIPVRNAIEALAVSS